MKLQTTHCQFKKSFYKISQGEKKSVKEGGAARDVVA